MRAARLHAYGQPLVIDEIPTPKPGPGEVLLRVEGAGFCHSDIHVMDGEIQILPHLPLTLGHENARVVVEVGRGVTAVREGESVAVFGAWGCGLCAYCVTGQEQLCRHHSGRACPRVTAGTPTTCLSPMSDTWSS